MTPHRSIPACLLAAVAVVISASGFAGCGRTPPTPPSPTPTTVDNERLLELRNVALAYLEAERHPEATAAFDELLGLLPDEPMLHANRGLIALRLNDVDAARPYLERAAELAPDHPTIARFRAAAAVMIGDDTSARRVLEAAVAANPSALQARWELLETLRRTPDAPEVRVARVTHLDTLLDIAPTNVVLLLARARARFEAEDRDGALADLATLAPLIPATGQAADLLAATRAKATAGDLRGARSSVIALDNVLKPSPPWQRAIKALRGPPVPVADPLWDFLAHEIDEPQTPPGTRPLRYTADTPDGFPDTGLAAFTVLADVGPTPRIGTLSGDGVTVIDPSSSASAAFALPFGEDAVSLSSVDLDNDRRLDLIIVERNGRLHIAHPAPDGAAAGWRLASTTLLSDPPAPVRFVLPWDYEPDGDLDLLLGHVGRPATLLRNNGDGTFQTLTADAWVGGGTVPELTDAAVADWDEDGDVDLIGVTADDAAVLLDCERSGRFAAPVPLAADAVAVAAVDLDNDGWIDLAYRTRSGGVSVVRNDEGTAADPRPLAAATTSPGEENAHRSIIGADADNDGWIDLFVRAGGGVTLLRNRGADGFTPGDLPGGDVRAIAPTDLDADGDLDLVVQTTAGGLAAWTCEGTPSRGWQLVRLESILDGGQRNNAFAVGGTIELRAGRQYQKRVIDGPVVHFGLGDAPRADAIRVLWPNGVPQNIVLPAPNQLITEEQELKGSCPFLLAFDGERERFVTDLLWRSPVGMKINAQVVAPIGTTRDHVKIESHQLVARDGRYDLTITAALWETIFFDEITLLAVDHPDDILFHIDERFSRDLPPLELHTVDRLRAPRTAIDHRGRDVLEIVRDRDGRRLGDFARGPYQGVAEMHHVELDLGAWDEPTRVRLFASGWIMPTDTSINVALGQGTHPAPSGIAILVADGRGGWIEAIPDAGFPSGKLKTIVLELTGLFPTDDHRIRVRTNLEIYWDRLAVGLGARAAPTPRPLRRLKAELGRIGFPVMRRPERTTPEWPDYTSPTQTPRWRDLVGWYTRYGDVEELVARTDDRFVIMNAGDAIRLSFQTPPPPPPGWTRSFILTSDGWVKDGDLNTVDSRTVAPLPYHGMTAYPYPPEAAPPTLRPSHADWSTYHTRIVTPEGFRDRLRRAR